MFRGVDDAVISSLLKCTSARLKRYGRQETVFVAQSEVRHVILTRHSLAEHSSTAGESGICYNMRKRLYVCESVFTTNSPKGER